jgi:thioesterase domain-containing protein
MEQRVANYVREIRTVQAHGPYSVMGWCAAGPLTVEVARHLLEAGETVDSVILFDSWLPGYLSRVENAGQTSVRRSQWHTVLAKLQRHREKMQPLSTSQRLQYIRSAVMRYALARRNRYFIRHWSTFNTLATRFRLELPQFMYNTTLTTFAAMSAYRPQPVPIHLSLIRARDMRDVAGASEACGWEQVATQGVEVLWAPGDHETMFLGDNLKATTALIRHCLDGEILEVPVQDPTVHTAS